MKNRQPRPTLLAPSIGGVSSASEPPSSAQGSLLEGQRPIAARHEAFDESKGSATGNPYEMPRRFGIGCTLDREEAEQRMAVAFHVNVRRKEDLHVTHECLDINGRNAGYERCASEIELYVPEPPADLEVFWNLARDTLFVTRKKGHDTSSTPHLR